MQARDDASVNPNDSHPDWQFVLALGGPTVVSRLCEITPQGVSQWRKAGMPKPQRRFLKLLRPDVFEAAIPDTPPADAPVGQAGELDAA